MYKEKIFDRWVDYIKKLFDHPMKDQDMMNNFTGIKKM